MLDDDDGYWIASYNADSKEVCVEGFHFWPCKSDRTSNAAQKLTNFLYVAGFKCSGYWRGYVGIEVCERWNRDDDLNVDGDPIDGSETMALERLIEEDPNFVENNCEYVKWIPWTD